MKRTREPDDPDLSPTSHSIKKRDREVVGERRRPTFVYLPSHPPPPSLHSRPIYHSTISAMNDENFPTSSFPLPPLPPTEDSLITPSPSLPLPSYSFLSHQPPYMATQLAQTQQQPLLSSHFLSPSPSFMSTSPTPSIPPNPIVPTPSSLSSSISPPPPQGSIVSNQPFSIQPIVSNPSAVSPTNSDRMAELINLATECKSKPNIFLDSRNNDVIVKITVNLQLLTGVSI